MFLSSQCGRDDTRITSQVPLTKAGEDGMGGDRGGSVWLGEVDKMLSLIFCKFISGFAIFSEQWLQHYTMIQGRSSLSKRN